MNALLDAEPLVGAWAVRLSVCCAPTRPRAGGGRRPALADRGGRPSRARRPAPPQRSHGAARSRRDALARRLLASSRSVASATTTPTPTDAAHQWRAVQIARWVAAYGRRPFAHIDMWQVGGVVVAAVVVSSRHVRCTKVDWLAVAERAAAPNAPPLTAEYFRNVNFTVEPSVAVRFVARAGI